MTQVAIRDALVAALEADMVGPMASDEVLETRPSRWYLAGFLVPSSSAPGDREDPTVTESLSADADGGPDDGPDDDIRVRRAFLPSSMGLSFMVPPGVDAVEVTARWADYRELDDRETLSYRQLERERRGLPPLKDEGDEGEKALRFRYWRRVGQRESTVPVSLEDRDAPVFLDRSRQVYLRTTVRAVPEMDGPPGTRLVSLFLVNGREPKVNAADERALFQVELEVGCPAGFVPRYRRGGSDHPDDRRNDLQFRDRAEWAVGHGVATRVVERDGPRCTRLATTWLPTARVHRMSAVKVNGMSLSMEALGELEDPEQLVAGMSALVSEYGDWIQGQAAIGGALAEPGRAQTAEELVAEMRLALSRIREGLALLAADELAFEAFVLTNRAMAAAARRQRPGDEPRWRPFQLAFFLLNISGITSPDHADRQRVELLFFPTGGGKTEAYLGVACYAMFLRRLRGQSEPHKGAGVAVLLRYTLRLLTLDQLKRAAQLTCAMELIRRERALRLGRHRFSIGLWVGRKATANRLADLKPVISRIKNGRPLGGEPPPVPFKRCPWCDTPLDRESYELIPPRSRAPQALVVGCPDDECPFNITNREDEPDTRQGIPVVVVDEHVYRELPTILVGTVDKFAALPWRGATGNLFGRVRAEGEAGFYGADEVPPKDSAPLHGGLLPPELIIQDELHLITGPLGTMVGLYETAIDALCRDKLASGPKIIASTATARRATEQIRAIFAREDVHLFPPQGVDDGATFFAEVDTRPETTRLYVGVASPGRSMKVLASRVYTCLLGAAQYRWERAGPPGADNPADTYMTLVAYFNALKELGGAQRLVLEDVNRRTGQLSRRRPLDREESEHFADRSLSYNVLELTSRQSTDEIARQSALLHRPYTPSGPTKTDVLLASSMISVGVDISRLGLMVVNGQPRTSAEYIQASSRVGRQTPGLVVTAFNLFKPRDRSHYERFSSFHESFYRYVEAASVTPFSARAVDRGLAGLIVGLARHLPPGMAAPRGAEHIGEVGGLEERIADLLVARAAAHRPDYSPELLGRLRERVALVFEYWEDLIQAVRADGQYLKYSTWEKSKGGQALLSTAVDDLVGSHAPLLDHFRVPISMRDVEPSVHIWVDQVIREARQ